MLARLQLVWYHTASRNHRTLRHDQDDFHRSVAWLLCRGSIEFDSIGPVRSRRLSQSQRDDRRPLPGRRRNGRDRAPRVAQRLSARWGKSFVVENRVGAGGNLAGNAVARSAPDGHTLIMATSGVLSTNISLYKNLSYNPTKDLAPVGLICAVPFVLVAHPGLPVQNVTELIKLAKSRMPKLNYASGGIGTFHHMMGEMLKIVAGIDMVHVPYKGGAPAVNDVVAGARAAGVCRASRGPAARGNRKAARPRNNNKGTRVGGAQRPAFGRGRFARFRCVRLANDGGSGGCDRPAFAPNSTTN